MKESCWEMLKEKKKKVLLRYPFKSKKKKRIRLFIAVKKKCWNERERIGGYG